MTAGATLRAGRQRTGVQAAIPDSDDQVRLPDGERARQVYGVGAPERMLAGEFAGVPLDGRGQLNRSGGGPELLPGLLGSAKGVVAEVMIARGGRECRADLRVGQSARQGGVATVPQLRD